MYKITYIYFDEPNKKYSIIFDAKDPDDATAKFVEYKPLADIKLVEELNGQRNP